MNQFTFEEDIATALGYDVKTSLIRRIIIEIDAGLPPVVTVERYLQDVEAQVLVDVVERYTLARILDNDS